MHYSIRETDCMKIGIATWVSKENYVYESSFPSVSIATFYTNCQGVS